MPVTPSRTFYRAPMSRSVHKSPRFKTNGVVGGVFERSQRMIGHVHAIGIHVELGPRCPILQVISIVVFSHPRSLDIPRYGVAVVLAEPFPAMFFHVLIKERVHLSIPDKAAILIEPLSPDRVQVRRSPVDVGRAVVVYK